MGPPPGDLKDGGLQGTSPDPFTESLPLWEGFLEVVLTREGRISLSLLSLAFCDGFADLSQVM